MRSRSEMVSPRHQFKRKRQKKFHDYSQKSIDNFKLIVVNPSPKLTHQAKRSIATYFGSSSQDQCIETNIKKVLTRVLKRWNENKSSVHLITSALTQAKTVAMKIYSFEIK